MKNGAPIVEVTTPSGSWAGAIIDLDIKSDIKIIMAPNNADPGIKYLWLGPIHNLIKWGVTSPTKPIIPQNATDIPTIIDEIKIIVLLSFSIFIPKCCASESPSMKISSFFINEWANRYGIVIRISIMNTICHSAASNPPNDQNVKLLNSISEDIVTKNPIIDPDKALIAIPDNSITIMFVLLKTLDIL